MLMNGRLNLAKENAELNQIQNVKIYESDRLLNVKEKTFAAILTNPPIRAGKKTVHDIFEQSFEHLTSQGRTLGGHSKETRCTIRN